MTFLTLDLYYFSGIRLFRLLKIKKTTFGTALFLAIIFFPFLLQGQANVRFRHLGKKHGLSQNSVFAIAQDGRGVMWFGTREGINEFDGYRFKIHRHRPEDPNSLPSDDVRSITYDRERNCLWVGTIDGLARYDFNTGRWKNYHPKEAVETRPTYLIIRHILVDSSKRVWVSTSEGLNLLEVESTTFMPVELPLEVGHDIKVVFEDKERIWMGSDQGLYIYPDKKDLSKSPRAAQEQFPELAPLADLHLKTIDIRQSGEYWFGTQANGTWRWEKNTDQLTPFQNRKNDPKSLSHDNIRSTTVAPDGTLWVGTFLGLNQYLPAEEGFRRFLSDDYNQEGLRNNSVRSVYVDHWSNLWVGTYYAGVNYLNEEFSRFQIYRHQPGINSLSFNVVSTFAETPQGNLWIGTEGGGLNFWDKTTGRFTFLRKGQELQGDNIKCLLLENSTLFIGTFQNGLHLLNTESRDIRHFGYRQNDPNTLSDDNVYALLKDRDTLWIGTHGGGLNRMILTTGQITHFQYNPLDSLSINSDQVRTLVKDDLGHLWVGTDQGLNEAIESESGQLVFNHFLPRKKVYANIFYQGELWVGTLGEGLFRLDPLSGKVQQYTSANGLPGNSVLGILPDEKGDLWLSTNNGLSRFNTREGVFTNYSHTDGLENLEFNYNAFYRTQSGEFLFGGTQGFTRFHPEDMRPSAEVPPVIFTGLTAFNREIEVDAEDGLLTKPLDETEEIAFKYGDANFTFHFAALDFSNPRGNRFAYRMVGLNDEWTHITGRPEATYTLQQEGDYIFELKAANKDGVWNPETRSIRITVLPPPARTWWAYLIYISILGLMVATIVRIVRLRQSYKLEHLKREQQAELHRMKMRFFTNVAHEFRTPLTLIIGPVEDLLRKKVFENNRGTRRRLGTIYNNAQRMLDLVNQLLTFRKIEEGHEPLQVEQIDLSAFLLNIFTSFSDHASMRKIGYEIQSTDSSLSVWFDREKMSKVFYNLLSNAFKFTPDQGEILVSLSQNESDVQIEIRDSGPGIDPTMHEQIFQRFYEKTPGQTPSQIKGTGIGLSLSRQLVKLHHGRLTLVSQPGKGSAFTVHLPRGKNHFKPEDFKPESNVVSEIIHPATPLAIPLSADEHDGPNGLPQQPLLLTVEDNPEIQAYISGIFKEQYRVITARNGKDGLITARHEQPDLILSDVMMPHMDGFELCQKLKTDLATSHIPVILLTARTTLDDRLEGLNTGADDYISKPFHPDELRLKVRNRLIQRQRMREQFNQSNTFSPKAVAVTSADEEFVEKLIVLVESNIENSDFNIEQLAQEMAVSRALLFTKIKALTNHTPKNFLKSFRLKRAVQLLETGKLNVSEVAYRVGFNEPKYFSKVFQKEYGCNPSEYVSG